MRQAKSWCRYKKQVCGHLVQVDVKFVDPEIKPGEPAMRFQHNGEIERSRPGDELGSCRLRDYRDDVGLARKFAEREAFNEVLQPHGGHFETAPDEIPRDQPPRT